MAEKKIKILIVDDIPEARERLQKLLAFESDFEVVGMASGGNEGIALAREYLPDIVLMDINMPDMDGISAASELRRSVPTAGVIMMSVQGEAEYIRRALQAGARDFLTKPPPTDELYATVRRVAEDMRSLSVLVAQSERDEKRKLEVQEDRTTHVIAVYSPQGGAGKTTIATNLAAALMREGTRVLLVDCDLQFGDVGVFLNLKPQATIVELIKSVDDLDTDLVNNVLVAHDSGLRVLTAPLRPEDAEYVPTAKVPLLIEKLRGLFDYIVVDMNSRVDEMALALFDMASRILLVLNPTLPALKNGLAAMSLMDSLEYPEEKTQLVLNRVTPDLERSKVAIAISAFEQKLRRKAFAVIPMDEKKVLFAVNRGISIVAKDRNQSPARELIAMADSLIASLAPKEEAPASSQQLQAPAKQPASRLGRLFGGG
ncbi:MAG: response regulator [Chloroflexi bacterium CFX4]|nr:response regulator [Chloroflexi bacterium CFX4]MDL1922387.1 MinD/ParA family protein [Chloroflexi bacterium CFX3]